MGFRQFIFHSYSDELLALLSLFEFEAFEESEDTLLGFIEEKYCTPQFYKDLQSLCDLREVSFSESEIESINWNAQWESSFHPVVVGDFCAVRASFHTDLFDTKYNVIKDPRMAFGTGHHETTYMMIEWMQDINFEDKNVLDHGCGTGVLSILAEKCKAAKIDAVDVEEDAFKNILENIQINGCHIIHPILGTIKDTKSNDYDIILANINRNVLMNTVKDHYLLLKPGGMLIMSGILEADKEKVIKYYSDTGFTPDGIKIKGEWVSIKFIR